MEVTYTGEYSSLAVPHIELMVHRDVPVKVPRAWAVERIGREPHRWTCTDESVNADAKIIQDEEARATAEFEARIAAANAPREEEGRVEETHSAPLESAEPGAEVLEPCPDSEQTHTSL